MRKAVDESYIWINRGVGDQHQEWDEVSRGKWHHAFADKKLNYPYPESVDELIRIHMDQPDDNARDVIRLDDNNVMLMYGQGHVGHWRKVKV